MHIQEHNWRFVSTTPMVASCSAMTTLHQPSVSPYSIQVEEGQLSAGEPLRRCVILQ
jgi:hypothetical protein